IEDGGISVLATVSVLGNRGVCIVAVGHSETGQGKGPIPVTIGRRTIHRDIRRAARARASNSQSTATRYRAQLIQAVDSERLHKRIVGSIIQIGGSIVRVPELFVQPGRTTRSLPAGSFQFADQ